MSDIHAAWFKYARYKKDLSQAQLGKRLRITQSHVSRIELGERTATESTWQALSGLMGISHSSYWKGPPA